jgi:D-alanyl-D-alanine carboxypeptidase/D-alanyl-D-alanine-endopeptidase (penicillin-binding protein 4)
MSGRRHTRSNGSADKKQPLALSTPVGVLTALLAALLMAPGVAGAVTAPAVRPLQSSLAAGMRAVGPYSGAEVTDLTTGQTLYANRAGIGRLPASVQKLYTTSTALLEFGPGARLITSLLGSGSLQNGTYTGTLYLRGGGDPTFGSAAFDAASYGTGATVQQLANRLRAAGVDAIDGAVVGDESYFDALRGTPATSYGPSFDVEGELSALAFNRGWADAHGNAYYRHPALQAAQQLVAALKAAGIKVPADTSARAGRTPAQATPLSGVDSPTMASLIGLTNSPSDNFFAETLLKDIGARFGAGGNTAAGAGVVRSVIGRHFGLYPRFNDGSGLSYYDRTSPRDIVSLLRQQVADQPFRNSLAVAGRTGTLKTEMRHTYAQGRCTGKTGTLQYVSNLVGYCHSRDGHTLAFAFLMNGVNPYAAHPIQNRMAVAVARYDG